jgi:uncharacterized protein
MFSTTDLADRFDSWVHQVMGLGGSRSGSASFGYSTRLDDSTLAELFKGDDIARRIVSKLPQTAMRAGYKLELGEGRDDDALAVQTRMEELSIAKHVLAAAIWGRLYGGAILYLGADDGGRADEPLIVERVRSFEFAHVIDRRDVQIATRYSDPLGPKFGEAELYAVTSAGSGIAATRIHESRCIRFGGDMTSTRDQLALGGWDYSVLQACHDALSQLSTGYLAGTQGMAQLSQGVFKIHGLADMIASRDKEKMQARMGLVDRSRSVGRSVLIDAEREDFTTVGNPIGGMDGLLDRYIVRVASAAGMPVTVLFGQSPAGMNATGESDLRLWYDSVSTYLSEVIAPAAERIALLTMASLSIKEPDAWRVEPNAVREEDPGIVATKRKTVAETDAIYINSGVLLPEEVAIARFSPQGWSPEISIDLGARERIIEAERTQQETKAAASIASAGAGAVEVAKTAFTGIQIEKAMLIVERVAQKQFPRETGIELIVSMLQFPQDEAERIMGKVGKSFFVDPAPDAPQVPSV